MMRAVRALTPLKGRERTCRSLANLTRALGHDTLRRKDATIGTPAHSSFLGRTFVAFMILACSSGAFEQEVRSINGDSVILTGIPTSPLLLRKYLLMRAQQDRRRQGCDSIAREMCGGRSQKKQ